MSERTGSVRADLSALTATDAAFAVADHLRGSEVLESKGEKLDVERADDTHKARQSGGQWRKISVFPDPCMQHQIRSPTIPFRG